MEDNTDRMSGRKLNVTMRMVAGTITGVGDKCRDWIDTGRLSVIREDIARKILFRRIKGVPEQMMALSGALRSSAGNESAFLDMGRTLQSVYTDTTELIRHIQDAIQEVTGDGDDNILSRAGKLAKQAETALTHRRQRVASSLDRIKDVADHLGGLHQACDHLGRIAMNLRVVGLNIGVESTRSAEGRDMFTVVSKEILQLSEKVDAIANRIREDATAAMAEQIQAFDTISGGLKELTGLTTTASGVTSGAVHETEKVIAAFLKAFETADVRFQEISKRVGEIVMGIQFHDNMRQRVEHITDALDDSCRVLGGRSSERNPVKQETATSGSGSGDSEKEALGHACSVVSLQKVQLADVITEINRVYRESSAAFGDIGREIGDLGDIMSAVNADIHGTEAGNQAPHSDPFSRLAAALTGLDDLLGRGDELSGRIEESVSRASEIGRRFSAHLKDIDDISFETKIKALNAIVKAGHMSEEGRTLEVLAQEMNRLSEQTNAFVAGVEEKLRRVGEFGDRIRELGKGAREENGRDAQDVSVILAGGIEEISRMRNLMNAQVDRASEKAGDLSVVVSKTVSDLGFLTTLADDMSGHLETLDAVDSRLSPLVEKWKTDGASGEGGLVESYTMERERLIHDAVFTSGDGSSDGSREGHDNPDASGTDGDISLWEDDGDGPELFTENDLPDMSAGDRDDISKTGDNSDVSLWDDAGEEPDETARKKEDDDEAFGDNIELF